MHIHSVLVGAAALAVGASAQTDGLSPPSYPSPWMHGGQGWDHAYKKAVEFKVNITTGTGWMQDLCVGATGGIPRLGFNGFCLQDSPLGIRF
ncbi:hypothetical protein VE04_08714, partial [Pseudogymnoascus sp. 24MN13]